MNEVNLLEGQEERGLFYTPEIEEFHVGFRYQVQKITRPGDIGWYDEIFADGRSAENLLDDHKDGKFEVRVKYLDQQDIEELGWECVDCEEAKLGDIAYNFRITPHKRRTYNLKKQGHNITITRLHRIKQLDKVIFAGRVKNFSELKRIMYQLGI